MALLSRTVVSLGRPFEDGELIGKTAPPDDLHPRLPPTTSTSTPNRRHTSALTSYFKMAQLHCRKPTASGLARQAHAVAHRPADAIPALPRTAPQPAASGTRSGGRVLEDSGYVFTRPDGAPIEGATPTRHFNTCSTVPGSAASGSTTCGTRPRPSSWKRALNSSSTRNSSATTTSASPPPSTPAPPPPPTSAQPAREERTPPLGSARWNARTPPAFRRGR